MDVVLGVAVADRVAGLALVGSGAASRDVIDQSAVDLAENPIGKLTETVVGTNRLLAGANHRLVATRLCWSDHPKADQLRRTLEDSGVQNIVVLSESEATALSGTGRAASSMRTESADDPTLALARGAAMAAGVAADDATAMNPAARLAGDATAMAPAVGLDADATAMAPATQLAGDATAIAPTAGMAESHAEEPQLAYSMAGDDELLPVEDEIDDDFYDEEAESGRQRLSGRSLLITNAVVAFAVIGFASLAVAVAITVRPTAAAEPVVGLQNAAPGKFMPLLPTQQQAPVPPAPPDQPNAGYQGGMIADSNGYIPAPSVSPGAVGTPVPAAPVPVPASPGTPGVPGFVPNPNGPIPIPIIIPFPGWRPPYPPYRPPLGPTTTYPTPTPPTKTPLVPTSPTNTPSAPTSPTNTPSTPTSAPPSTPTKTPTSAPPTTSKAPYTPTQMPTTATPAPSTPPVPPHTQTQQQQTVAPKPVTPPPVTPPPVTSKPVFPQLPHGGH